MKTVLGLKMYANIAVLVNAKCGENYNLPLGLAVNGNRESR